MNMTTDPTDIATQLQGTLEELVGGLVFHPDAVRVVADADPTFIASISCHPDDYGIVLGGKAATLLALRAIAASMAMRHNVPPAEPPLILEPQPKLERQLTVTPLDPDWTTDELEGYALRTLAQCFRGKVQLDFEDFTPTIVKARFIVEDAELDLGLLVNPFETVMNVWSARHGGKKVRVSINLC